MHHGRLLLPTRPCLASRLAVAAGLLVLSAEGVRACGLWFCLGEAHEAYAPMRVPVPDGRSGPVWTSNGWVYLADQRIDEPAPYRFDASRPPQWRDEAGAEPPLGLK